jgi:hypothetical protein
MKNANRPTIAELLELLNAHIVYTPVLAVVKSLTTGCDLARIGRFDDLRSKLVDLVQQQQKEDLR